MDYYYDGNDNLVYLVAGGSHTLAGDEIGPNGEVAPTLINSTTVELEWREDDKIRIIAKILEKAGANLKAQDTVAISNMIQQRENKA